MTSLPEPKTIQKLMDAYPSFALLAGMQLDLFTPFKDSPLSAEQIADTIGGLPNSGRCSMRLPQRGCCR